MGEKKKRQNDAAELDALYRQIEHAKNEDIAIKAIEIARYWLNKADRQTVQIQNLERRNNGGKELPSVQPEIIRCKDCIYYDPPHVDDNGERREYKDMPNEAFDVLGTGLVSVEYGINVGGRCARDYNAMYSEDKRVL